MPLAVVLLALAPTGAWGVADVIKSANNDEFDQPTYHSDEGDLVQFQHTGGGSHNVTSTQFSGGECLFSSATISSGSTAVDGTQLLPSGTYPFVCTIHEPEMAAELVVRESGAPPPGPGPGPGPEEPGPEPGPGAGPLILHLAAKKQALKKKLKLFATASADSTLVSTGKAIKETTKQLAANQKTEVKAKLNRKARHRLEGKLDKKAGPRPRSTLRRAIKAALRPPTRSR
jgi:plastocyanin